MVVRRISAVAGALAVSAFLQRGPEPAPASALGGLAHSSLAGSPIKHVVVFFQENHSFDNVLGRFCVSTHRCDGATTGGLANGHTIALATANDVIPDVVHSDASQSKAIAGGAMTGFSRNAGCQLVSSYACYTQFDPSQIPNLTGLAGTFAVSDRTFEMSAIPSFGAHVELVAQQLDGFTGDNPVNGTVPAGNGWGCDSNRDVPWRAPGVRSPILVPACVPAPSGSGPYRASPVQWVPTIMDRLDSADLSWRIYAAPPSSVISKGEDPYDWAICPVFADCLNSAQHNKMVPTTQVIADAKAGALPSFSILLPADGPSGETSQHNGSSMLVGDQWIGQVLSAIGEGPDWSSTAVFITYDDCGCFYDHVPPPPGLGIRVPMVIVSPFAKAGFTDSTPASFASMLAFTDHLFGLHPLAASDANAYDYSNSFDFSQTPLPSPAHVPRALAPAEASYLKAHPPDRNDPT